MTRSAHREVRTCRARARGAGFSWRDWCGTSRGASRGYGNLHVRPCELRRYSGPSLGHFAHRAAGSRGTAPRPRAPRWGRHRRRTPRRLRRRRRRARGLRPGRGPRRSRRRARRGRGRRGRRRSVHSRSSAGAAVRLEPASAARCRRSPLALRRGRLGWHARGLGDVDRHVGLRPRRGEGHRAANGRRGWTAVVREGRRPGDRDIVTGAQRLAQLLAQRERLRVPRLAFARVREHHFL